MNDKLNCKIILKKYSCDQRQIQQLQVKNVAKSIGSFVELELSDMEAACGGFSLKTPP